MAPYTSHLLKKNPNGFLHQVRTKDLKQGRLYQEFRSGAWFLACVGPWIPEEPPFSVLILHKMSKLSMQQQKGEMIIYQHYSQNSMKKNKDERSESHHTLAARETGTSMGGTGAIEVIL